MILIHENEWWWGRKNTIVLNEGRALCAICIEKDDPSVAWLEGVIVHKAFRGLGYGNQLLDAAKKEARRMGAKVLFLNTDAGSWMEEWYKRNGWTLMYHKRPKQSVLRLVL